MVQTTLAGAKAIGSRSVPPRPDGGLGPVDRRQLPELPEPPVEERTIRVFPGRAEPRDGHVEPYVEDARPTIEEQDLLVRLRRGDELAFARLYEMHWDGVFRVVARLVGDADAANDVAQEVFVQLLRKPPQTSDAPLRAWLYRVAVNRGYNELRANRRRRTREDTAINDPAVGLGDRDGTGDALTEAANRAEERALVRRTLLRLPERQRDCLALRAEGLSYAEIAASLEVAPSSVGTLLARAERAFKEAYQSQRGGM